MAVEDLKFLFLEDQKPFVRNQLIPAKPKNLFFKQAIDEEDGWGFRKPQVLQKTSLRVLSYNVHMWMDPFDNANLAIHPSLGPDFEDGNEPSDNMVSLIRQADADVLFLQEFVESDFIYNNRVIKAGKAVDEIRALGYTKMTFCNIVPSWLSKSVGNAIFVHARVLDVAYCRNGISICEGLRENIRTIKKAKETSLVQGVHLGTQETRCFITMRLRLYNQVFVLCTSHLDIASESQRMVQLEEILGAIEEEVRAAKAETEQLKRDPLNAKVQFADPVVVLGGDFNAVNPWEVEQAGERVLEIVNTQTQNLKDANAFLDQEQQSIVEKTLLFLGRRTKWGLIQQSREQREDPQSFNSLIKNSKFGVVARVLKDGIPGYSFVVAPQVMGPRFTNWNLTKIDHIFFGFSHPEKRQLKQFVLASERPASDHLPLLAIFEFNQNGYLPDYRGNITVTDEGDIVQGQGKIYKSMQEAIQSASDLSQSFQVDPATGLYLFYPQLFCFNCGNFAANSNEFLVMTPVGLPKNFGQWNQNSYLPGGDVKSYTNPRVVISHKNLPEALTTAVQYDGKLMKTFLLTQNESDTKRQLGDDAFVYLVRRSYFENYGIYSQKSDWKLTRNLLSMDMESAEEIGILSVGELKSILTKQFNKPVQFFSFGNLNLIETRFQFYPTPTLCVQLGSEIYRDTFRLADDVGRQIFDQLDGGSVRCMYAFTGIDPQIVYNTSHAYSIGRLGYTGAFVSYYRDISMSGVISRQSIAMQRPATPISVFQKRSKDFLEITEGNSKYELKKPSDPNKIEFLHRSFVSHQDDAYQIATGNTYHMSSTKQSTFGRSLLTRDAISSPLDQEMLSLLRLLTPYGAATYRPVDQSPIQAFGDEFISAFDSYHDQRRVVIEYLLGWVYLDFIQRIIHDHNQSQELSAQMDYIYSDDKSFTASLNQDTLLRSVIHAVTYPRRGRQEFRDYAMGPSWIAKIRTKGLAMVKIDDDYILVAPLQHVRVQYEGYLDFVDEPLPKQVVVHRKHVKKISSIDGVCPRNVNWESFNHIVQTPRNVTHLRKLQQLLNLSTKSEIPSFRECSDLINTLFSQKEIDQLRIDFENRL